MKTFLGLARHTHLDFYRASGAHKLVQDLHELPVATRMFIQGINEEAKLALTVFWISNCSSASLKLLIDHGESFRWSSCITLDLTLD